MRKSSSVIWYVLWVRFPNFRDVICSPKKSLFFRKRTTYLVACTICKVLASSNNEVISIAGDWSLSTTFQKYVRVIGRGHSLTNRPLMWCKSFLTPLRVGCSRDMVTFSVEDTLVIIEDVSIDNKYEFWNEISDFAYFASVLCISTFSSRPVKLHYDEFSPKTRSG